MLNQLPADVFHAAHVTQFATFAETADPARRGVQANPFIDPDARRTFLRESQQAFDTKLAAQRKTSPPL